MIDPQPAEPDTALTRYSEAAAPEEKPENPAQAQASRVSVESADLFKGRKTVEIRHNGAIYRLQATRLGKLILTK